jgi:predicted metalloprotease with PDZ domain
MRATCNGETAEMQKITAHVWELNTEPGAEVALKYKCYAAELTAGNTYFDEDFLLVNPVNCLVYPIGMESEPIRIGFHLPEGWTTATSFEPAEIEQDAEGNFFGYKALDVQELLDTPVLASPALKTLKYTVNEIPFYIDIHGDHSIDADKLLNDFRTFTETQIEAFGGFPVDQYHFLLILLPQRAYHGVEHEKSTVIILGPADELGEWKFYKELLGVSSHELYHTWNVKHLRPADWSPYDFTGPNFSRLGYVAEGVTTYMGDWMLWQSGVFSDSDFLNEITTHVQRHMDNEGRFHLSLGDASIDTWTDGYGKGSPRRRVSIYIEGALLSFVCDVWLMKQSGGSDNLSECMRRFNTKFGGPDGFTEDQWWAALSENSDLTWNQLRQDVIDDTGKLMGYVEDALENMGLQIETSSPEKFWEGSWGAKIDKIGEFWMVTNVLSNSPAEDGGLWFGDIFTEVNGIEPETFFTSSGSIQDGMVLAKVRSGFKDREVYLHTDHKRGFATYKVIFKNDQPSVPFITWKNHLSKGVGKSAV